MIQHADKFEVYLEIGTKRTFAGATDWPGWCRSGRDENSALRALFDYGPRYARALNVAGLEFRTPVDEAVFMVSERLDGNGTTDFGAPGIPPACDQRAVDETELLRLRSLLMACWETFDNVVNAASGKALSRGPRGGGRELETIVQHVQDSQAAYLERIGGKLIKVAGEDPDQTLGRTRREVLNALGSAARGEVAAQGPRGGARWLPRYFVRRLAWHVLDHAWEIEDRAR
jgi:hypothetical protein